MHEPSCTSVAGSTQEIPGPLHHDPLELLRLPLADGDQVNHRLDTDSRPSEAAAIRHVSLDKLAAPGAELRALAGIANEAPDRQLAAAKLVDDVASDEAATARDQYHLAVSFGKFCQ